MVEDFVDLVKQSVRVFEFSEAGKANDSVSEQPHCHCNSC